MVEVQSNWRHNNYRVMQCHDCDEEYKDYNGPKCPDCGSHDTKSMTRGAAPHESRLKECNQCGNTWDKKRVQYQ